MSHEETPMRPLTAEQYAKVNFRRRMRDLPYPEKVRYIVEMQRRLAPIYAQRGIIIRPWSLEDETPEKKDEALPSSR